MKIIGYISTTILLVVYSAMLNGWALSKLWSWFIVKTFGLPPLTIPAAIGLASIVTYMTMKLDDKKSEDKYWETLLKGAVVSTVKPLFALGFGAIVKLWL